METKDKILENFASIIKDLTLKEIDDIQGALKIQLSKMESGNEYYSQEEVDELIELDKTTNSEIFSGLVSGSGKTQSEIAEMMNVPQSSISQWVTGARQPKLDTITRFASSLGKEPIIVFGYSKSDFLCLNDTFVPYSKSPKQNQK